MVFNVNQAKEWADGLPARNSGIYLALSDDLIKWAGQVKLVSNYVRVYERATPDRAGARPYQWG